MYTLNDQERLCLACVLRDQNCLQRELRFDCIAYNLHFYKQNVQGKSDSKSKKDFHKLSFSFLKQVCLTYLILSLEQMRQYEFQSF